MKKFAFMAIAVILLLGMTTVSPVSASWPYDDIVTAVNEGIIPWLEGFVSTITGIFIALFLFVLYPFILLIYLGYEIISRIYMQGAAIINIFLGIPNFVSALTSSWLPDEWPSVWTLLFLMSVGVAAFSKVMRMLQYIKSWIPILFG